MKIALDLWDVAAVIAIGAVVGGLAALHWSAAVIFCGCAFLWVYYHREKNLAPK